MRLLLLEGLIFVSIAITSDPPNRRRALTSRKLPASPAHKRSSTIFGPRTARAACTAASESLLTQLTNPKGVLQPLATAEAEPSVYCVAERPVSSTSVCTLRFRVPQLRLLASSRYDLLRSVSACISIHTSLQAETLRLCGSLLLAHRYAELRTPPIPEGASWFLPSPNLRATHVFCAATLCRANSPQRGASALPRDAC